MPNSCLPYFDPNVEDVARASELVLDNNDLDCSAFPAKTTAVDDEDDFSADSTRSSHVKSADTIESDLLSSNGRSCSVSLASMEKVRILSISCNRRLDFPAVVCFHPTYYLLASETAL